MFELATPWILWGLPLPLIIWFLLPSAKIHVPIALILPFHKVLTDSSEKKKRVNFQPVLAFILVWCLILLAIAGPRWVGEPQPLAREGRNIMLTLDLSGSMQLQDLYFQGHAVSRLAVVKYTAEQFIKKQSSDRIGLILFGSRAYLQTPLTYDHHSLLQRLEEASVGLAGQTTSIGDALGLAVKRLQNISAKSRIIILLTDGVNNSGLLSPLKAAELAKLDGIKVYTIGLGAEIDPNTVFSMQMSADLDEATLKAIAQLTEGRYFRATDVQSLNAIYQTISKLATDVQQETKIQPRQDYYTWPLALAIVIIFYWLIKNVFFLAPIANRSKEFRV